MYDEGWRPLCSLGPSMLQTFREKQVQIMPNQLILPQMAPNQVVETSEGQRNRMHLSSVLCLISKTVDAVKTFQMFCVLAHLIS